MDPYKVLGVTPDTSKEDIKKAYRKLALEHHPDKHGGDDSKMKEINAAFDLVKDGNYNPNVKDHQFHPADVADIINSFFGNARNWRSGEPSIRTGKVKITLEEAYNGCEKKIKVSDIVNCKKCKGRGCDLTNEKCTACKGKGQVGATQGFINIWRTCYACKGLGRKIGPICAKCKGSGKKTNVEEVKFTVPPGAEQGRKISATPNLEIIIVYGAHPEFTLLGNGKDVVSVKNINMFDAMLGGTMEVKTLAGVKTIKINPGVQPGTVLRIKGAGMKTAIKGAGNHLVELNIKLLNKLTEKQKELLNEIKQIEENK